jgi:glycosyltransferase involved in cell wall biosynthesis
VKVLINAVSAKMGGALAYLTNFLPNLAALELQDEFTVFVPSGRLLAFRNMPPNIRIETETFAEQGAMSRVYFDQWTLRSFARRNNFDCIFSTANFGILHPPVPQITSVRNPVYFSHAYYRHVREIEGRLAVLRVAARRRMVALSCSSSSVVVTPTEAMRDMLLEWCAADPAKCVVINHGFDRETFLSMNDTEGRLDDALARRGDEALLFYPSLYGKHKNFDTLIEAVANLVKRGRNVRLFLTCAISPAADPYQRRTSELIERHKLRGHVTQYGSVPYQYMPRIYRAADVVVWPSFAESFGHPLLEAMASRKPIVSSGIACNSEMARDAAVYFDTFEPVDCADKIEQALKSSVRERLVAAGQKRLGDFSWRRHVEQFVSVMRKLSER